jgi:RNA polymerase sigma-70 factor (ECF subfamily)
MNEWSDERLIEAAQAGDEEAFIRLVTRYKRRVLGLAARFTPIRDELDDICQDVFIKIFKRLRSFRNDAPFEHWLSRVAVNTCFDALRQKKLTATLMTTMIDPVWDMPNPSHEERQAAKDAHDLLYRALAKLSAPERLVITLLELEEKSIREIADLTGWSESNVKVRAFRARKALKKILEAEHHE